MGNYNNYMSEDDLVTNSSARIPVCLCLDVSGSMSGEPIEELNRGVEAFYDAIRKTPAARDACEIAIVTFGSYASIEEEYSLVDKKRPVNFMADGLTSMGEGVEKSLQLLENRKQEYKRNGVDYYQPWLILMSDGGPTDDITSASMKAMNLQKQKKLVSFALGIGEYADLNTLNAFSIRGAKQLKGYNFVQFFEWVGKSVAAVSVSNVGDSVKLDLSTMDTWAEV